MRFGKRKAAPVAAAPENVFQKDDFLKTNDLSAVNIDNNFASQSYW